MEKLNSKFRKAFKHIAGIIFFVLFLGSNCVKALEPIVVINEVNWAGSTTSSSDEWVELKNQTSSDINLSGWTLENAGPRRSGLKTSLKIPDDEIKSVVLANGYYLISRYAPGDNTEALVKTNLTIEPDWRTQGEPVYLSLSNSGNGDLILRDKDGIVIDQAGGDIWLAGDETSRYSMERNDSPGDGLVKENWHTAQVSANLSAGKTDRGTPKSSNSKVVNLPPSIPVLETPLDGTEIVDKGDEINFTWSNSTDPEKKLISYNFYLGCSNSLTDKDLVDSNFEENNFKLNEIGDFGDCSKYYWKVTASDGVNKVESTIAAFSLKKPVYSSLVIISELCSNPVLNETNNEWIELFNNSSEEVNLNGWVLEDTKGTVRRYLINRDLIILPFGYTVLYRKETGIVLNNDEDSVKLIQPNNNVLFQVPTYLDGEEGWAWHRKENGNWQWTTKPTPGRKNIISLPVEIKEPEGVGGDDKEVVPLINTSAIKINSGEIKKYENKVVKIEGELVSTQGNNFYLDDGSGEAKFYIRPNTGIKKPTMKKGDLVEAAGLVDFFRQTWRIIIRRQEDIKVVQVFSEPFYSTAEEEKVVRPKKSEQNILVKKEPLKLENLLVTTAQARGPTNDLSNMSATGQTINLPKNYNSSVDLVNKNITIQLVKAFTGLASIILVLFIIKIININALNKWRRFD